ncbi:hypothetical protein BDR05DRAFT_967437 [Suillus weaverae]|nr:hypothetical protein BDR05DRAFT_967437 [Suillus weaverae]
MQGFGRVHGGVTVGLMLPRVLAVQLPDCNWLPMSLRCPRSSVIETSTTIASVETSGVV